jgi:hypothetical protein
MQHRTMLQKLVRGSLIAVYWLVAVSLILYFGFWTSYRDALLGKEPPEIVRKRLNPTRHIDATTMQLLGSAGGGEKLSSFVHFQLAKRLDAVRICALGDSVTFGSEVAADHDYPSYLQRIFNQQGFDNVQVLNFGKPNYGFAQIYVMWKNVASRFGCDFVLLMPSHIWSIRDTTFNHTGASPGYLHARLVLESEEIRLIAPIGENAEQRLSEYVRPIPHWRYLRYDRHPPNVLEAMVPSGRTIPNPFYYDPRPGLEEATEIYTQIIRTIANDGPQVIVLGADSLSGWYSRLVSEQSQGIGLVTLSPILRFPYLAPAGHPSAWGQELSATAFFRILTGNTESALVVAGVQDKTASSVGIPKPLNTYNRVRLSFLGQRVGYFVQTNTRRMDEHDQNMKIFRQLGIGAILALESADGNIADACLLPLPTVPPDGVELVFVAENGDDARVSLGKVHQLQPDVAIFKADITKLPLDRCLHNTFETYQATLDTSGHLLLAGETIARIDRGSIQPNHGPMLSLRNSSDYLVQIESLTTPRVTHIELQLDDGTVLQRPLLTIQPEEIPESMEIKRPPSLLIEHSFSPTL